MTRIVVTGGHLTPALATISQIRKLDSGVKAYFFGRKYAVEGDKAASFEFLEIKNLGIPFFEITTGRLQRRLTKRSLITLAKIIPGFLQSFLLLKKIKPDLVLTFGGYIAFPVAIAAQILKIPIVAHEQSPSLGVANRVIFKFAKLIGVSDQSLAKKLGNKKVVFTGPILREDIFKLKPASKDLARFLKKVGNSRQRPASSAKRGEQGERSSPKTAKLIYVTGGATGSRFLNQLAAKTTPKILKDYFVIHQTGNLLESVDFKRLTRLREKTPKTLAEKYFLTEFIDSADIGAVLFRADLVICRSGANTTAELAALAKVSIVIPLEWGKEQKEIAQRLERAGASVVLFQEDLTANIFFSAVKKIFANFTSFKKRAVKLQQEIPLNGAKIFSQKVLEFL